MSGALSIMASSSTEPSGSSSSCSRSSPSPSPPPSPSSTSPSSLDLPPLSNDADSVAKMIQQIKSDLCEDWLQGRAKSWGPATMKDTGMPASWTATITTKIGSSFHYITCPGSLDDRPCVGSWSRKDRHSSPVGLHCTYGGWVTFDGKTIADAQPRDDSGAAADSGGKKSLRRLRRLWAEHVLQQQARTAEKQKQKAHSRYTLASMRAWLRRLWADNVLRQQTSKGDQRKAAPDGHREPLAGIWDQALMDRVYGMLSKATAQRSNEGSADRDGEKLLGHGSGGWSGVSPDGTVLKRDPGNRRIANGADRCDLEPGGIWRRGDVEVWTVWNGWSCLVTRDGRWRPAYHLELLLCLWMAVVDYGTTREAYRNRQSDWLRATEWLWVNTPPDVPQRVAEVFRSDSMEMIRRERERMRNLQPEKYIPDAISTEEERYRCYQDRAGEVIAYHTVGEGLETPRGLVSAWVMIVLNDILDYERDVLCGETNNVVRGLTSGQQVVDAAVCILEALRWSMDNGDHDLTNAILGTTALYLVTWRYNGPKLARYEAISVRDKRAGVPPELEDIAKIVRFNNATTATPVTGRSASSSQLYGELFDETNERVRALYSGCTCRTPPEGHDAWQLFAQAMDQGGNDEVEEKMHVALVALNNGANAGDVDCECGVDLLLCEGFVRFLDPDTGIVARLHYRSSNTEQGNTVTE